MTGQVLPFTETMKVIMETARKNSIPIKSAFFDASPHIRKLIECLHTEGYVFMALNGDQAQTSRVASQLGNGHRADV